MCHFFFKKKAHLFEASLRFCFVCFSASWVSLDIQIMHPGLAEHQIRVMWALLKAWVWRSLCIRDRGDRVGGVGGGDGGGQKRLGSDSIATQMDLANRRSLWSWLVHSWSPANWRGWRVEKRAERKEKERIWPPEKKHPWQESCQTLISGHAVAHQLSRRIAPEKGSSISSRSRNHRQCFKICDKGSHLSRESGSLTHFTSVRTIREITRPDRWKQKLATI